MLATTWFYCLFFRIHVFRVLYILIIKNFFKVAECSAEDLETHYEFPETVLVVILILLLAPCCEI